MARFNTNPPKFKPPEELTFNWDSFDGGLNTFFKDNEINKNEAVQLNNLMLTGKGSPTKRWGTDVYFLSGVTGAVRGLGALYLKTGTKELLSVADDGVLTKKSNASYTQITGVSWASGNKMEMAQLKDKMYFVNGQRELAKYDGTTLAGFATIGRPSGVIATGISGVSGTNTFSYVLTHTSQVGETLVTDAYQLANQPLTPKDGSVKLSWTNASSASGVRTGTNIYGRTSGFETFIASVDGEATQYVDNGDATPQQFGFPPDSDTTGGPIAKYIIRFKDRLIYAGINNDPTLVLISARSPNHEKFSIGDGGGLVRVSPDDGDEITGLATKGEKIIVFKERSIWEITLDQVQIGNFFLIEPKYNLVTGSVGCASHRSIKQVENDIFFLASFGKGIYVIGNEANFSTDLFRINEISLKIRNFFTNLTTAQQNNASAVYHKNKYLISVPGKDQTMVFDRERVGWVGPWSVDATIFEQFVDSDDILRLTYGKDNQPQVNEMSERFLGDENSAFSTIFRSKREDFGDWTQFKTMKNVFTRWTNVAGTVTADIRLEKRNGNTITQKNFTVSTSAGSSGWGADEWADTLWGDTEEAGGAADLGEIVKWAILQKPARNIQLLVKTNNLNDNYELLSVKGEAQAIGPGYRVSSWKV